MRFDGQWMAGCGLLTLCLVGCGGGDQPAEPVAAQTPNSVKSESGASNLPPTASIALPSPEGTAPTGEEEIAIEAPKEGSPEALVLEITQLCLQPFPETDDIEKQRAARKERNQKVVKLATDAIALTHKDSEKEQVFNIAVHRLMEATFQLAMQGDQDSVDALYGHAENLFKRKAESKAAAEGAWFVAKFAHENAQRFAQQEPRWVHEFSKQARSYVDRFATVDANRALALLSDAAASCDFHGMRDEAMQCYAAVKQKFPESLQAENAVIALRRLELVGKKVDLGGPTIDGGFVAVEEFRGSPVMIVFWSTQAKPFLDIAPDLIAKTNKFEAKGLHVIGVNLDTDESAIDAFAEKSGMSWRNIFHTDPTKRGWNNPVVSYYGIPTIPQIWLVNADGLVVSTHVEVAKLDAELAKLLTNTTKTEATTKTPPASGKAASDK